MQASIKYTKIKNIFKRRNLIGFLKIRLTPQETMVIKSRNEANPKLCSKKSDINPP